ncbi:hypothetical protein DFH08DRAFT_990480, partial [Mycena albidolilacea]
TATTNIFQTDLSTNSCSLCCTDGISDRFSNTFSPPRVFFLTKHPATVNFTWRHLLARRSPRHPPICLLIISTLLKTYTMCSPRFVDFRANMHWMARQSCISRFFFSGAKSTFWLTRHSCACAISCPPLAPPQTGRGSPAPRHKPEDWMSGTLCSAGALAHRTCVRTMRRLNNGRTCILYLPHCPCPCPHPCPLWPTRYNRHPPLPSPLTTATDPLWPTPTLALVLTRCNRPPRCPRPRPRPHCERPPCCPSQRYGRPADPTLPLALPLACCDRPAATDPPPSLLTAATNPLHSHPRPRPDLLQPTRCNPTPTLALALAPALALALAIALAPTLA